MSEKISLDSSALLILINQATNMPKGDFDKFCNRTILNKTHLSNSVISVLYRINPHPNHHQLHYHQTH